MKKLVLLLGLTFLSSTVVFTSGRNHTIRSMEECKEELAKDDSGGVQFKMCSTGNSDGFSIYYAFPSGEKNCTASWKVYDAGGKELSNDHSSNKVHSTDTGWAYFDGKAGLSGIVAKGTLTVKCE